jgi:hypothetical protein
MTNTPYRQHLSPQSANTGLLLRIRDSSRCSEEGEAEGEENQNLFHRRLRFLLVVLLPEPAKGIRDRHHVWERFDPIPLDRFARSKYSNPDAGSEDTHGPPLPNFAHGCVTAKASSRDADHT